MKKKILKNVAILTFALFGLGIIGHNVSYATEPIHEGPGDGGSGITCTCSILFWYNNCSAATGWGGTCRTIDDDCWKSNKNCDK